MHVAVHTRVAGVAPVRKNALLEVLYAPFADLYLVPDFIARLNETVRYVRIKLVSRHVHLPFEMLLPASFTSKVSAEEDCITLRRLYEILPQLKVPDHFPAIELTHDVIAGDCSHGLPYAGGGVMEIKRCYIIRYGHTHIIRVYRGVLIDRHLDAAACTGEARDERNCSGDYII